MKGLLAILLVAAMAVAGCAGTGGSSSSTTAQTSSSTTASSTSTAPPTTSSAPPPPTSSSPPTTSPPTTPPTTGPPPPPPNRAPTVSLQIVGRNGFTVNFTLNGADANGDALNYTFDADGVAPAERSGLGSEFPVRLNYTYPSIGIFNATLSVSDGKLTATARLSVNVSQTGVTQTLSGTFLADNPACQGQEYDTLPDNRAPYNPGGPVLAGDGLSYVKAPVLPATIGMYFLAAFDGNAVVGHVMFLNSTADVIADYATGDPTDPTGLGTTVENKQVPVGAASVVFYGCFVAGSTGFEYTAGPGI